MQPSSVVACSDLAVSIPLSIPQLCMAGTSMCLPRRVQWGGGEAGENSREEVRSVFVPICHEGAVL